MTNKNALDGKVERIRQEYVNKTAKKLANENGVSQQSIYNVANGRTYKERGGAISHRYNRVTDTVRDEMRERYAGGESLNDIAAQMGRAYATVYYWCVVRAEDEIE